MRVYQGIEEFDKIDKAVVTTGTFDGVHIGHQSILNRLNELAKKVGGQSVLLTFFPHPRMVIHPDAEIQLINTIEERTALLEAAGVQHLIIHPFTKEFSRLSSVEFVRDLLVNKIGTEHLVIGYDHHFGRNREGSFEHLMEFGPLYGFQVEEIPAQDIDEVNVSSTKIRKALIAGEVRTANEFLGHAFTLSGSVVKGNQIGRTLGFPTANIQLNNPHKLIPADGIYAVRVMFKGKVFKGMLNIGVRPTIEGANKRSIEVNIFDFNAEIYGRHIQLQLIERIRDEQKFNSLDSLKFAMAHDKTRSLEILSKW